MRINTTVGILSILLVIGCTRQITLTINSTPERATVTLNEHEYSTPTKITIDKGFTGSLSVSIPGYATEEIEIEKETQDSEYNIVLHPIMREITIDTGIVAASAAYGDTIFYGEADGRYYKIHAEIPVLGITNLKISEQGYEDQYIKISEKDSSYYRIHMIPALIDETVYQSIDDLMDNEKLIRKSSPNGEYLYLSNIDNDPPTPVRHLYSIDGNHIDPHSGGFWLVCTKDKEKVVYFQYENVPIFSPKWDVDNSFFILDWGTGPRRNLVIYDLTEPREFKLQLNSVFNKNGYSYSSTYELFAICVPLNREGEIFEDYDPGLHASMSVGVGILILDGYGNVHELISPEVLSEKLVIEVFSEELVYTNNGRRIVHKIL